MQVDKIKGIVLAMFDYVYYTKLLKKKSYKMLNNCFFCKITRLHRRKMLLKFRKSNILQEGADRIFILTDSNYKFFRTLVSGT